MKLFASEPALIIGAVQAALALAVSFGLDLSPEQVGAIMAFVAAVLALVLRRAVVSPATIASAGDVPQAVTGLAGRLVKSVGGS